MNKRTRKPLNKNFLSGSENSESEEDSKAVSNTDDDLYDNEMTSDDSKSKSKRVPKTKSIIVTIPTKTKPPATLKLKAMPMIPRKQPAKPLVITTPTTTTHTTNSMLSDQSDDGNGSKDEEEDVDIGNDSGNDDYSGNEEDEDISDISADDDQDDDDDDQDDEDQRASKKKKTTVTKSIPVTKKPPPKIIIKGTIPKKQSATPTTPTTPTTTNSTSTTTSPTLSPPLIPPQASPALLKKKPGRKKLVQTESQTESNRSSENDLPFKNNNFSFPIENQKKPYKSIKQILAMEPIPSSPMFPTWQNIEVSQTCQPVKKYCDITGLQSNYVDPISTLRYYDSSVFQLIRSFTDNVRQNYLQLRKSGFRQ